MATAILSSQISSNPNSRLTRRQSHAATTTAPCRRKRIPTTSQSKTTTTTVVSPPTNTNLVIGQVKILKRGETLNSLLNQEKNNNTNSRRSRNDRDEKKRSVLKLKNDFDLVVDSTKRIGPEPEVVQKQIGSFKGLEIIFAGDYAGSGCSYSPPPTSVPIPWFLGKNKL